MIFVDRTTEAPPGSLLAIVKQGKTERELAIEHHEGKVPKTQFAFKKYKEKPVVEVLNRLFHGKCAYCESPTVVTQPYDVEHFRPKGGYNITEEQKSVLKEPGYYWLAATWENLLPSCILCNRESWQLHPDGTKKKTGKGNHFPLEDETVRATKTDEETRETPLLLNPCVDRPEEHLEFTDDGNICSRELASGQESRKGQASIDIYGLRRTPLVQARKASATLIKAQIVRVEKAARGVEAAPELPSLKQILQEEFNQLIHFMDAKEPYAGMARQIVESFVEARRARKP